MCLQTSLLLFTRCREAASADFRGGRPFHFRNLRDLPELESPLFAKVRKKMSFFYLARRIDRTARNVRILLQLRRRRAAGGIRGVLQQVSLKPLLRQAIPARYPN
jgi:hypothetical protein